MKWSYREYKAEWDAVRYMIGGKMFALLGTENTGRLVITLKLIPEEGRLLRSEYSECIIPGYYMNKDHWNSTYLEGDVPDFVLKDMISKSYRIIFDSLPKKLKDNLNRE